MNNNFSNNSDNINKYHIERSYSNLNNNNLNNNNLNNNNFSFNNNFNNLTFNNLNFNNLNFNNNFNNLTFNNFNFNNNFNFYNKNTNITTEECLKNIPENVDSDDHLAYVIQNENVYNLFKNTTYYKYFKEITSIIKKLRNLIVEKTFIFNKSPDNFTLLKIYIFNILKKLNSYLNNYIELYSSLNVNEETGRIKNVDSEVLFISELLFTKDELLKNSKELFPILCNDESLNEDFSFLSHEDEILGEITNNINNEDKKNQIDESDFNLFSSEDENSKENIVIEINNDENLNKGFNNNIKSIKNKNSSLKNNKIGLGKHKLIVPIINNINSKYQNNCLTTLNNTSNNNSNYLNKKTKKNEEKSFSKNAPTKTPTFWYSRFLYQFRCMMTEMKKLEREGVINSNEMYEIKKTLYDKPKDFYNYLRNQGKGKVDDKGTIIYNNLDEDEKEKYDEIMAAKEKIYNKYFSANNNSNYLNKKTKRKEKIYNNSNYLNKKTKRNEEESFSNNTPNFWYSSFLYQFKRIMTEMKKLEREGIINSNEMYEIKKTLYDKPKNFYKYLRKKGKGKVNDKGTIIYDALDEDEKEKYDEIMAAKEKIYNKYFSTENKNSKDENKVLFLCESTKDENSKGENNLPYFSESNLRRGLMNLKARFEYNIKKATELATNLGELDEKTIDDLYNRCKNFYNKLREQKKVDREGNVIVSSLSENEKLEYNKLKAEIQKLENIINNLMKAKKTK